MQVFFSLYDEKKIKTVSLTIRAPIFVPIVQTACLLFDSLFEAISLTQPNGQISSENRMTLKPHQCDKTDSNNSAMHSCILVWSSCSSIILCLLG